MFWNKRTIYTNNIGRSNLNDKELTVIKNDVVLKLGVDYTISTSGEQINFIDDLVSTDTISLRKYDSVKEAYIPPSSTFLKINPAFIPE